MTNRRLPKAYKLLAHQFIVDYLLDHPCVDCSEDDPVVLEFDHRDPSQKRVEISELLRNVTSLDFAGLRDEMNKCDVRCANCHRRKSARNGNYRRYLLCKEMRLIDY